MKKKQEPAFSLRPHSAKAFGACLRVQREALELTLDQVAAKTRISKPYLSNIETGRIPGVASPEKLQKIAVALHLPPGDVLAAADWLRTPASVRLQLSHDHPPRRADGAIDLDALLSPSPTPPVATSHAEKVAASPMRQVPIINRVAAGKPSEFTDLQYPAGIADAYIAAPDLPDAPLAAAFAVRVSGDSMFPEYTEGEILIVGAGEPADGDDCIVRLADDANFATTFKRIFFERDSSGEPIAVRLVPLNPKYTDRRISLEEITGIYPLLYRLVPAKRSAPTLSEPAPERVITTTRVSIEND